MSIFQIIAGLILGVTAAVAFRSRSEDEGRLRFESLDPGSKTYLIEPLMFPAALTAVLVMTLIVDVDGVTEPMAARLSLLFLHISAYYALLLILLPLLRRLVSARACATLWLAPTLLYYLIWVNGYEMEPLFALTLPRRYLSAFMLIWACGFALVMLWQLTSHLRFRRFLLLGAAEFENEKALALWRGELLRHGVKASIPILVSDAVNTPLTIGCFERTMRLILPKRGYTEGELELIFRHELRHILRCDTRAKLFLGFCAAMCWFNPLAWIAYRKVADDLELSCDEAILADADEDTRRKYADLLLESAGNGRGYTTCLSAAAGTLRYRLRNVLKPRKRLSGGVLVGFAILALIATNGAVALADGPDSVREAVFSRAPAELAIDRVSVNNRSGETYGYRQIYRYDAQALTEYIASLSVRRVYVGNYKEGAGPQLYVDYAESVNGETAGLTRLELSDGLLFANIPYDDFGSITYIVDDEIDWDYVAGLLDLTAPNPDPAPRPPEMTVRVTAGAADAPREAITAVKRVRLQIDDRGTWVAEYGEYKTEPTPVEPGETKAPSHYLYDSGEGIGGFFGAEISEVRLEFSYEPANYTVLVENWDRSESYILHSDWFTDNLLPIAQYSAHYTVRGGFDTVRNTHYEMEFYFDIGLPVDSEQLTLP